MWASLADLPEKEGNKGVCEAFNLLCLLTAGTAAPAAESASSSMAAKACPPRPPILLSTRCLLLPTGIQAGPLFREERPVLLDVLSCFPSFVSLSRLLAWSISQSSPSLTLLYIAAVSLVVRLLFLLLTHRIYYRCATFSYS